MPDPGVTVAVQSAVQEASAGAMAAGASAIAPDWSRLHSICALEVTRQTSAGPKTYISTAILLTPTLGIAAAHSLASEAHAPITRVVLVDDYLVRPSSPRLAVPTSKISLHPLYRGNQFDGIDLARFELDEPITANKKYFELRALAAADWTDAVLQRVGFGGRGPSQLENRRTWVLENFRREWIGPSYVSSDDQFGFPGDSGGPVYLTRTPGTYELVGLHVGRMLDPETQAPRDRSNTLVFTPDLIRWIEAPQRNSTENTPKLPALQKLK